MSLGTKVTLSPKPYAVLTGLRELNELGIPLLQHRRVLAELPDHAVRPAVHP